MVRCARRPQHPGIVTVRGLPRNDPARAARRGPGRARARTALQPSRLVRAAVRAVDPGERAYVDRHAVAELPAARLADPTDLVDATAATGADHVHIHIDRDVLDPTVFSPVGTPEPGGLTPQTLLAAVTALVERYTVASLTITEYE
ncbi:hypothetical protein B4N89_46675 [Embleya scabrispora]|uniref:Uncharacterized protein n=1 Tax=Embleya scabrispora TaxID=159449 RepID=A0A1T3NI36_9ACTN|nr:hypothetical protein B4N89_46675 [Embleya scabrispora]